MNLQDLGSLMTEDRLAKNLASQELYRQNILNNVLGFDEITHNIVVEFLLNGKKLSQIAIEQKKLINLVKAYWEKSTCKLKQLERVEEGVEV